MYSRNPGLNGYISENSEECVAYYFQCMIELVQPVRQTVTVPWVLRITVVRRLDITVRLLLWFYSFGDTWCVLILRQGRLPEKILMCINGGELINIHTRHRMAGFTHVHNCCKMEL